MNINKIEINRLLRQGHDDQRYALHLVWLRIVLLVLWGGAIATAQWGLEIQLPFQFLWGIFALHLAVVLHGWWRTRGKQLVASNKEVAVNLALDVTVLTLLLYLSGGWTNPLVGLYLVPLAIAAATLKAWHTWLLCALTICCYSLLTRYFQPLPHIHSA
ncbi:MAG: hypothetical protein MI864_26385, partial [Pseudomonadales bacterium]|nr:hypothetical protein [Pseudomonadales bacterium]